MPDDARSLADGRAPGSDPRPLGTSRFTGRPRWCRRDGLFLGRLFSEGGPRDAGAMTLSPSETLSTSVSPTGSVETRIEATFARCRAEGRAALVTS